MKSDKVGSLRNLMKKRLKVSFFVFVFVFVVMDVVSSETEDLHTKTKQDKQKRFFPKKKTFVSKCFLLFLTQKRRKYLQEINIINFHNKQIIE